MTAPIETPPPGQPDVAGALKVAADYAYIDGEHHKMWVIDQMVRHLTGCPVETRTVPPSANGPGYSYEALGESDAYREFVGEGEWDEGIAP